MLSRAYTMGRTLPQGHCHFFVGMRRLRHGAATLMGGKEEGDAHISRFVTKWKKLWRLQQKRGGGVLTARFALSRSRGAPMGHAREPNLVLA